MTQTDLPEAVSSITLSVTTPKGFPALFTVRDVSGTVLLDKVVAIEERLVTDGYKPQVRQGGYPKKEIVFADFPCPTCKARTVVRTDKTGKTYYKCETNKWNPNTKTAEGCTYFSYTKPNQNG